MEFHLSFFALRKTSPTDNSPSICGKRLRDWEDLSLLARDKTKPGGQENYRLHKAQISCVIHGFDEWQWVTYAFEDTEHNKAEDYEGGDIEVGVDDGEVSGDEAMFCQEINEDPITRGHDANRPIWRPRQYFLKAFEVRIKVVREEWDDLVDKLEVDRTEYVYFLALGFERLFGFECGC
jgi:hypothetical protein